MQQKELKKLKEDDKVWKVIASWNGFSFNVLIDTADGRTTAIRTARGGERAFKTTDAVRVMLNSVGIFSFEVGEARLSND